MSCILAAKISFCSRIVAIFVESEVWRFVDVALCDDLWWGVLEIMLLSFSPAGGALRLLSPVTGGTSAERCRAREGEC